MGSEKKSLPAIAHSGGISADASLNPSPIDSLSDLGTAAAAQPKFICSIVTASVRRTIYLNQTTKESCRITCDQLDGSNPYRECSFNGAIFREIPSYQCLIVGRGGKIHYNQTVKITTCQDECAARETTHPFRSCSFRGQVFRATPASS